MSKNKRMIASEAKRIEVGRWIRVITIEGAKDGILVSKSETDMDVYVPFDEAPIAVNFNEVLASGKELYAVDTDLPGCFATIHGDG